MKKTLLILGMFMLSLSYAFAGGTGYYYYTTTGVSLPYYFNPGPNTNGITPTLITSSPANDVISGAQSIPFSFSFYGNTYNSYKASDNGYITFDLTATKSVPFSKSLPDTASATPKNAIFALWTDFELKSVANQYVPAIQSYTYGTAPNRVHVIEWFYVSQKGVPYNNSDFYTFSIRLYEAGGFDIVHNIDIGTINNALIGCQNSNGTLGTMVDGSPYLGPPNPTGAVAPVYNFKFGVQPANDGTLSASVSSTNMFRRYVPTFITGDNSATVSGTIYNYGASPISSINVNYSVDGGTPQVYKITGVSIAHNGGSYPFSHPQTYSATNPGHFQNIKVWLTGINGGVDANPANDTTFTTSFVINGTNNAEKKPLCEEYTGAWCGFCPNGGNNAKILSDANPAGIFISYHNDDLMSTPASDVVISNYVGGGFPSLSIDRHYFQGENYISLGPTNSVDNTVWDADMAQEFNTQSVPVKLDILTKSWDSTTRTIKFTVTGQFTDYVGGDIRLNAMIVEDKFRGPDIESIQNGTMGWDQHNYFNPTAGGVGGSTNPLYNEAAYIVGYVHNNVLKSILTTSPFGDNLSDLTGTNAIATPNQTFSKTFTYHLPNTVPVDYSATIKKPDVTAFHNTMPGRGQNKPEDIRLIAFMSMYNPSDMTYSEVLNATQAPLLGWSTGIKTAENSPVHDINLYPNPTSGQSVITYNLVNAAPVDIEIYNTLGQKMQTVQTGNQIEGNHKISFDMSQFNNGLYFISINSNGTTATKEFMVQK